MVYSGRIDSVYFASAGGEVAVAAPTGTQVVSVGFPVDFDQSGGTLQHGPTGNLYTYTAVDIVAETVTLTAALGSGLSFALGDMLSVWPLSTEARAVVKLDDSQDEAPVDARVTHALRPLLAEGGRDPGMGESVLLDIVGTDWVVTDLSGEIPQLEIDAATLRGDDFVIDSDGAFFYADTPALGNILAAISGKAVSDAPGNAVPAGISSWVYTPGSDVYVMVLNDQSVPGLFGVGSALSFNDETNPMHAPGYVGFTGQGGGGVVPGGDITITTGQGDSSDIAATVSLVSKERAIGVGQPYMGVPLIIAVDPTTGIKASWQGLGSGTGVSGFTATNSRFMVLATGFVHVDLRVNFGSAGAGPVTFATAIPAAYRPSGGTDIRQAMSQNNPSGALAHAFVNQSTGQVQIVALSGSLLGLYDVQFQYPYI